MDEKSKITTKTWYVCSACKEKLESISIGSGSSDLFGFGSSHTKAMYCDNKGCDNFGFLTVAGIKREE